MTPTAPDPEPAPAPAPLGRYPVWRLRHPGPYDDLVAVILANRRLTAADLANSAEVLHDPHRLADLDRAAERLATAIRGGERIVVFGDYDVDGVTSTAVLVDFLRRAGADVRALLPDRLREGYGMKPAAARRVLAEEPRVVVTADNGVSAFAAVGMARDAGVDVVVVDHHRPSATLPPALAVVNPNRRDCPYPFKGLAAVGVAFKLVQALSEAFLPGEERRRYLNGLLDLVALGTVADVAPMIGENRFLTRRGLQILERGRRPGVAALLAQAGLAGRPLDAGSIGFCLGPRLNSAGRLASAEPALALLVAAREEEAARLAADLEGLNARRQALQEEAVAAAEEQVAAGPGDPRFLVVRGADWHLGVIGLVAARLAERHGRPAAALTAARRDGSLTGSARTAAGYDLIAGVERCADLLAEYGGHPGAAGFTLAADRFEALAARLAADASERLSAEDLTRRLDLDCMLRGDDLSLVAAEALAGLGPFGAGNPTPAFLLPACRVVRAEAVGAEGTHLKLRLAAAGTFCDALWWRQGAVAPRITPGDRLDVAGALEANRWNGVARLQVVVEDLRPAT